MSPRPDIITARALRSLAAAADFWGDSSQSLKVEITADQARFLADMLESRKAMHRRAQRAEVWVHGIADYLEANFQRQGTWTADTKEALRRMREGLPGTGHLVWYAGRLVLTPFHHVLIAETVKVRQLQSRLEMTTRLRDAWKRKYRALDRQRPMLPPKTNPADVLKGVLQIIREDDKHEEDDGFDS